MRTSLYIGGAALEFIGILLVGSPDLAPFAPRLSAWLRGTAREVYGRVLGLVGRPPPHRVRVGAADALATMRGGVSAVKSVNPHATLEEKVAFLLTRDQEAQRDLAAVAQTLQAAREDSVQQLAELRAEMEAHVAAEIEEAHRRYLPLRYVGIVALLLGLPITTAANFVG